jgi:hypothetical protein
MLRSLVIRPLRNLVVREKSPRIGLALSSIRFIGNTSLVEGAVEAASNEVLKLVKTYSTQCNNEALDKIYDNLKAKLDENLNSEVDVVSATTKPQTVFANNYVNFEVNNM